MRFIISDPAPNISEQPVYYVANLLVLLQTVEERYDDLLSDSEREFIDTLKQLSSPARRLYVRLAMRKGPLFRSDLLSYPEIESISNAADELEHTGLLAIDGEFDVEACLATLRVPELKELFGDVDVGNVRKAERIVAIIEQHDEAEIRATLNARFSLYAPLGLEFLDAIQLLFFGNRYQNLSEFIITELGVVQYECYEFQKENRPFSKRDELDALVRIYELRELFEESRREATVSDLTEFIDEIPAVTGSFHVDRRRENIVNDVARQFERIGEFEIAMSLYESVISPPARERRARIYTTCGDPGQAAAICESILRDPYSAEELDFAATFLPRIAGKLDEAYTNPVPEAVDIPEISISLSEIHDSGVEQGALEYLIQAGHSGYFTENGLWSALFGLVFWDIVFMPVPGAFFNQYQRGPSDLSSPGFYQRREVDIEKRLEEIRNLDDVGDWVMNRYDEKADIANAFVNWKRLDREMLTQALLAIPARHIASILGRVAHSPMSFTSGFPDLILFAGEQAHLPHSTQSYLLVEVKGPGDHVQRNQRRWFSFFHEHEIPAAVAWVTYE